MTEQMKEGILFGVMLSAGIAVIILLSYNIGFERGEKSVKVKTVEVMK